jgi:fatty acid desaturase
MTGVALLRMTLTTMVPADEALPDVLPTDRLQLGGKPKPPWRDELRRIPGLRNAVSVASCWAQAVAVVAGAVWLDNPIAWIAAFFLMGRSIVMFNILGHEAAHRLLFRSRRLNDGVGRWLLAYPAFQPLELYRRIHFAHHRDEMGPDEPDLALYNGYPITRASLRRKLTRDAVGITGWKLLRGLFRGLGNASTRPVAVRILATQAVLLALFTVAGHPWLYLFLWFAPFMTVWRVLNRLRSIAEHGGMIRSADRRRTTHHARQSVLARFWMVPYNTGWHLAHHVDMAVPWRNLPALHHELVAAGWITPSLEYPSYPALWRALSSRATTST